MSSGNDRHGDAPELLFRVVLLEACGKVLSLPNIGNGFCLHIESSTEEVGANVSRLRPLKKRRETVSRDGDGLDSSSREFRDADSRWITVGQEELNRSAETRVHFRSVRSVFLS